MKKHTITTVLSKLNISLLHENDDRILPTKLGVVAIVGLGIISFFAQQPSSAIQSMEQPEVKSLDTYIPEGQSLVPIEVANYESLDQVIGQFGVVDLFSTPLNPLEKAKRVAFAVKLIRSPKSPRHFSVLSPADKAHKLAGFQGQFTVVVRNPKLIGTKFVNNKRRPEKRRVVYETEAL